MKTILVTGGCGFIGSHITLELLIRGNNVVVFDSNINSSEKIIDNIKKLCFLTGSGHIGKLIFIKGDIRDKDSLNNLFVKQYFKNFKIDFIIHLAGLKSVRQSIENPLEYWDVNVNGLINLLNVMFKNDCLNMVFSSSATVYGNPKGIPILENSEAKPINPYGRTKLTVEEILKDNCAFPGSNLKVINLRFFNPIGAHPSGILGENPNFSSDNIFPNILNVALKKEKYLKIFGNNWPTCDGTVIRDFIHVIDIAESHIAALEYLKNCNNNNNNYLTLNIGTGLETSILKLIRVFEKTNKLEVPYRFFNRRPGDTPFLLADVKMAKKVLNWEAKKTLSDMCKDGWKYALKNSHNFLKL